MKSLKYLKELESYSTIRELAARLPTFYGNKWRESPKKLEALISTRKSLEKDRNSPVNRMRQDPDRKEKRSDMASL